MAEEQETRKQKQDRETRERLRRLDIILAAEEIHRKNREKAYISKGGVSEPDKDNKTNQSWKDRVGEMKHSIKSSRLKMRTKGKKVFKGK